MNLGRSCIAVELDGIILENFLMSLDYQFKQSVRRMHECFEQIKHEVENSHLDYTR